MSIPRRTLGKTGFSVSEIGFGAWAIGAEWGETVPEAQAKEALHAALDAGMNFIDTADIYGMGRSEKLIGQVQRERSGQSERIYVATKMGKAPGWTDDYESVRLAALGSCERLGVDALDLVQLHCIDLSLLQAGKVFEHLEKIKSEGIIRHYGASVETIGEGLFCIHNSGIVSLQVIFNIFRQRLIDELFPSAQALGIGIIARVPLASGVLTGKFQPGQAFDQRDHRHYNANGERFNVGETFAGVQFDTAVELAEEIRRLLANESPPATLAQKAMRWILDFETVTTVIPGAKSPTQARDNAGAAALPALSSEAHERLASFYRERIHAAVRGRY
ncbi:MAG: aldo/keto reductase [Verrucomicrobiales bacterium]